MVGNVICVLGMRCVGKLSKCLFTPVFQKKAKSIGILTSFDLMSSRLKCGILSHLGIKIPELDG